MKKRFAAIYFLGMLLQIVIRAPYVRRSRARTKEMQRESRAEQSVLAALSAGLLGLPALYAASTRLDGADYLRTEGQRTMAGAAGTAMLAVALWLFWRSHHDLGANWSPTLEIATEHELITAGVYRSIRHPMYTSQLLNGIAQALLLPNAVAGLGGLAVFALLAAVRVPQEEQMMRDEFGVAYRLYMAQSGRFFPPLSDNYPSSGASDAPDRG